MPRQKKIVQSRINKLLESVKARATWCGSTTEVPSSPPISSDVPTQDGPTISMPPSRSVELLPVDDVEGSEDEGFAVKMATYFLEWTKKIKRENETRKRARKYTGNAARTLRGHRKIAKDTASKNKSTLVDFWAPKRKRARLEHSPILVNMETLALVTDAEVDDEEEESSDDEVDNVADILVNGEMEYGGGITGMAPDEAQEAEAEEEPRVEVDLAPDQSAQVADANTNAVTPIPSVEGQPTITEPTITRTPNSLAVLHPNDSEGEDPDDLQRNLWGDRQLMIQIGKKLTKVEKDYHNKMEKLLKARLASMKTLINFYTSDIEILTWRKALMMAAQAAGKGVSFARNLRRWILTYARSDCVYAALPHTRYGAFDTSLLQDEDLSQRIRQHLQTLGTSFKAQDVVDFVSSEAMQGCLGTRQQKISLKTAQLWLKKTHRYGHPDKGMYIDGHEREDVVNYRNRFLQRMEIYARRMPLFNTVAGEVSVDMPQLGEGENLLILVTHDESTFYENDRKHRRWIPLDETPVPQPKGEGVSVMVSDFLSPSFGRLQDADGEAHVFFHCGKNRDGYFDNDDILKQTEDAIKVFERMNPGAQGLFMFDNATTHQKHADNALSAIHMPKSCKVWRPGQPMMRDGVLPTGEPQPLYWPVTHPEYPGYFKGMEQILKERRLWKDKLKAQCSTRFADCEKKTDCCCRRILFNQPDFVTQKSSLEELVEAHGHLCDFYPKFHCELNFIEQYWGASKFRYRQTPPTHCLAAMEECMKNCLDDVPLLQVQRYWNRSLRFMDAYRRGLSGAQAIWANKQYHGHRTLPTRIMEELDARGIAP